MFKLKSKEKIRKKRSSKLNNGEHCKKVTGNVVGGKNAKTIIYKYISQCLEK